MSDGRKLSLDDLVGVQSKAANHFAPPGPFDVSIRAVAMMVREPPPSIVTLQDLIAEASDIQIKALAKGHYSAAVSALTVKAKLSGHWIDRTDNKTTNVVYAVADEPLTEDVWIAKHAGG